MLEILEQILEHEFLPITVVILLFIVVMVAYSRGTRRLRFEEKIATSKVNSLAVGLVEIVGNVRAIEQCKPPLFKNECVGYSYEIERIRTDSDTKRDSYYTKYIENHIEPFFIEDDTGKVLVDPEGLMADKLPMSRESRSSYRYSCSYLRDGEKVMVIGRAQAHEGKLIIQRDEQNKIFTLTPYDAVLEERAMKPLMSRVFLYFLIAAVATALIIYL